MIHGMTESIAAVSQRLTRALLGKGTQILMISLARFSTEPDDSRPFGQTADVVKGEPASHATAHSLARDQGSMGRGYDGRN